ncbi:MAG: hypothetical protein Q9174_000003 [Haloplaca sp. 1 TL-2023]
MSEQRSNPRPVPSSPSPNNSHARSRSQSRSHGRSSAAESASRATSIARLALSPAPSSGPGNTPGGRRLSALGQGNNQSDSQTLLASAGGLSSASGPGQSAIAAALQGSFGSPPRFGTPPRHSTPSLPTFPANPAATLSTGSCQSNYGSFDTRSTHGLPHRPNEDLEVVKRHLVQPSHRSSFERSHQSVHTGKGSFPGTPLDGGPQSRTVSIQHEDFSSLQLQGGDMTREVYRWTADAESQSSNGPRGRRSRSFHLARPGPENEALDIASIKVPGGFRRNYLRRKAPESLDRESYTSSRAASHDFEAQAGPGPRTSSFIEFLTLYGHFAGEELEEIKEEAEEESDTLYVSDVDESAEYLDPAYRSDGERRLEERSSLLASGPPTRRKRKPSSKGPVGRNSPMGAAMMLLKSFVGTGVLFLPKAYLNGGMLFSNLVLLGVAALSYYCFILLVNTRLKVEASFGDMGGILYGKWLRFLILSSVALSQVGFVAAYIVFTSENLQAFILAVSNCRTWIDIKYMVLMQLIIFLPLSLIRDISALSLTAYIADGFILLGLIYLYYFDIFTLVVNRGVSDIVNFNPTDWPLFIGTAIFTFEGVGLIIPIQESMRRPSKFPPVLAAVMIVITVIFVSMGALSYAAFGSSTRTVVLLNLPQDDKFVNAVQFLYSLAILLSTPLQLFPAIRIMENGIFTRSGKNEPKIKLGKNVFRFCFVMVCALIAWGGAGDLDKFVAVIGTFCCLPLVYVYPALLHLKAVAQTRRQQTADVCLCVFGFVVMLSTPEPGIALPDRTGPILVNTSFRRYALSSLVNTILGNESPVPFDFLINGTFLRSSLDDYLTQHGISSETTLSLVYVKAATPPVHLASFEHDDWVSAVDVLSTASAARTGENRNDVRQPGHERILSGSYDGLLRIWNMSSQVVATSPGASDGGHTSPIKAARFVSSSQLLSSGSDRVVRVWRFQDTVGTSLASISPQIELHGHASSVDALAVHQSCNRILSASADHAVGFWSTRKSDAPAAPESTLAANALKGIKRRKLASPTSTPRRGPLAWLRSHTAPVSSVIFAPGDSTVAYSASWDHSLKTWDLLTSSPIDTRSISHSILSLAAMPDLHLIAAGTSARQVKLIDPRASATSIVAMTLKGHTNAVVDLAHAPNSMYSLASGSHDGTCRVWDVRSTKAEREGQVGQSVYSIGRDSAGRKSRAPGEGSKVFSVVWDAEVGIVSAGEDKRAQINRGKDLGSAAPR